MTQITSRRRPAPWGHGGTGWARRRGVEIQQRGRFRAAQGPHSNDGALAVLPGSHRGPVHDHYDAQGRFMGCMRPEEVERLDRSRAPLLTLPAGSIHIHHYRLVRGTPPRVARRTAGEMPLPPDFREGYTSIYELQRQAASINP